ncbi:Phosphatidylserine decarboxylase proenzyme [Fundidesulfovibrio magnetotacticus]|uniref:Phosphatidylserine decarboxylase proenzyme n=1 Tax=Fundidesulfovibrio magnetotacticus TaxID=2730080 RepID=A0A6V8LNP2_9BACT|nr:phosphatidylserine decarboxylase family protein [Fundidesulfovibrio magnetotacticus]GFK92620.1 Phosphatidylserine decarboxylase proenzyme [Fundidesulfovibrio magnetotacticus]
MRKPSVSLTPEGWPSILLAGSATLVFALLGWAVPAVLGLAVLALLLNFFRDPERFVPADPGVAVAPADGRVIKVTRAADPLSGEERTVVCIFMNVFNVHVNRACVAGRVSAMRYWEGKFINASFDKASEDNERLGVQLADESGDRWTMVQIAGLIARRIIPWAETGDHLKRGQRYGMIKFGSRVDVYLPEGWEPAVEKGARTAAGQTVIAKKA